MEEEINEMKPLIRSILLSMGRRASEQEFLKEFYSFEGQRRMKFA